MPPFLLLLSLSVLSAVSPPPIHLAAAALQPQEEIEVSRPIPFNPKNSIPSCTLPLLSHSFAATLNLPPTTANYSAPKNCTWSTAVLHFSAASNGTQTYRIAAVWLSGTELLRTSTPVSGANGTFWNLRKDVTRYSALLRRSNLNLSVMLENTVDDFYTGVFHVNITLLFYNDAATSNRRSLSTNLKLKLSSQFDSSLQIDKNPADLIIPVSASGEEGFWFKINSGNDAVHPGIKIPANTYRAVIEVYASAHEDDELWFSNPPDLYIKSNGLDSKRGHGSYREVLIKLDDIVVGSVFPYPVIFTGGINPLFWNPIVSIGAFNLPSYEIELTPFLSILLDNKLHHFEFGVAEANPFWLIDANLHLWLDDKSDKVQAGPIKYEDPTNCIERKSTYSNLDGKFQTEGDKKREFSGWVSYSAGYFTIDVTTKVQFKNEITYSNNGTTVKVARELKVEKFVDIKNPSGGNVESLSEESKYPLEMEVRKAAEGGPENYSMTVELKQSLTEEKKSGKRQSKLENEQECSGWMSVHDQEILSGVGKTSQNYQLKDNLGCYSRMITAVDGDDIVDTQNFSC